MKERVIVGKVWVITNEKSELINDIDTDQIFHNAHLAVTDINLMGQYAFGNLKGWEDFSQKAEKGDMIVAGKNFGCGSSRQQAVDCFISLGISLLICGSFGAIYKRNAMNSGFPIISCSLTSSYIKENKVNTGDILEVDLETGKIFDRTTNQEIEGGKPFSKVQMDIYQAGNLFRYGKEM